MAWRISTTAGCPPRARSSGGTLSTSATFRRGAIRMLQLRNAVRGGSVSGLLRKSVTKMYRSTLLALRGGGWVSN